MSEEKLTRIIELENRFQTPLKTIEDIHRINTRSHIKSSFKAHFEKYTLEQIYTMVIFEDLPFIDKTKIEKGKDSRLKHEEEIKKLKDLLLFIDDVERVYSQETLNNYHIALTPVFSDVDEEFNHDNFTKSLNIYEPENPEDLVKVLKYFHKKNHVPFIQKEYFKLYQVDKRQEESFEYISIRNVTNT